MNEQKFQPGDRVHLNEEGQDWWAYDAETYHIFDQAFEVRECIDDPERGRLYVLSGFPYPVQEDWLMTEEDFEREFGPDEDLES